MAQSARRPGRRVGRPALLDELPNDVICRNVTRYLKLGCTHVQAAKALNISVATFYAWIEKYPQFSDAVKAGELEADADVVSALFRNATGNRRIVQKEIKLPDRVEVVDLEVEDAPNVAAQIFWLKNRARTRDKWRDVRASEVSGPDGRALEIRTEHVLVGRQLELEDRAKLRAFLQAHVTDVEEDDNGNEENDDD